MSFPSANQIDVLRDFVIHFPFLVRSCGFQRQRRNGTLSGNWSVLADDLDVHSSANLRRKEPEKILRSFPETFPLSEEIPRISARDEAIGSNEDGRNCSFFGQDEDSVFYCDWGCKSR